MVLRAAFSRKKSSLTSAWYRRNLPDGTVYYTPERHSKRKVILAATGTRDPTPGELATALEAHPEAELEKGAKLLIEHDSEDTTDEPVDLPGGVYTYETTDHIVPSRLEPMKLRTDSYVQLPGIFGRITSDIQGFLKGENIYRKLGLQYRRGILLYGSPGNGKTSLIREIIRTQIPNETLVLFMDSIPPRRFINVIRATLSGHFKIIIFEELALTLKNSNLDHALAFLDGEMSLDRCLILATTNYPERLPGNIVDRPSRFDKLYQVRDPNEDARKTLLEYYLGRNIESNEIEVTKGLSTAGLRETCLLVHLKDISVFEASQHLKRHKEVVKKEFGAIKEIGITSNFFDDDNDEL